MKYLFTTTSTASDLNKKYKIANGADIRGRCKSRVSVTVLANFSTQYLVKAIFASLVFNEIDPIIYESAFDQWEFELSNPESETNKRRSDYTLLIISSTRLMQNRDKSPYEFAINLKNLLTRYKAKDSGEVIVVLPESLREGFDQTSIFYDFVKEIKKELLRELAELVHFVDIDPLIMEFGFQKWHPAKFLTAGKLCCHPNCFPLYGNYLSTLILSLVRRPTRLIIVDLDNTLWHGVVGDLGWDGIVLDRDSKGYHHLMLQRYLLSLKEAGVLLAVCSKNSIDIAKKVFERRREMILKFDDFVAHEISWGPKSQGVKRILEDLNLTENGVMFLDDSKFEREEVRSKYPSILIPELPDEIEDWCEYLVKSGSLTIGKVNKEDRLKSAMYYAERQRKNEAQHHSDYLDFLNNLCLVITPEVVDSRNLDRVLELIHKTNQFNLTTRRHSSTELRRLAAQDDTFCYCYSLKDKYSEYGIIGVFIAEKSADGWHINTWLLSCRAMGRGVENFIFQHFISKALCSNDTIFGQYFPTDKNEPVNDLLSKMGFVSTSVDGMRSFRVGEQHNPQISFIKEDLD